MQKYASFAVLSAVQIGGRGRKPMAVGFPALRAEAHRATFEYDPKPGFLYVRSRAISSRCNDNFDEFPAEEIKQAYRTFLGKPVFVNHVNDNHRRARGVIIDAALHEDVNPDGSPDTWCEVLMEVDAVRFPKLAEAILKKHIERTSMGTDVAYSVCSFCGNRATTPLEYCAHIPKLKGKRIRRTTASGAREDILVREICHGLSFFENSLLVEEPADPTAYFLGVDDRGLSGKVAKAAALIRMANDPEWEESEHPRGQPTNRGQFAEKPGLVAPGNPDADEQPKGKGKGKGKGSSGMGLTKDDPIKTEDVEEAAAALAEGRFVQLQQPRQVSTLLDKLAGLVQQAKASGEAAPRIDLCKVTVQNTNLFCVESKGIPRIKMPQLMAVPAPGSKADAMPRNARGQVDLQENFRHSLIAGGFTVERTTEKASFLKATQNELNGAKVAGMVKAMEAGTLTTKGAPIFTSNDNYIVDGHHRWASLVGLDLADNELGDIDMDIERVDMDIITLLQAADEFCAEWGLPRAGFGQTDEAAAQAPAEPKAASLRRAASLVKQAIKVHVRAPQLERGFGTSVRARHLSCYLDVSFTTDRWEAKLSTPGSYYTFDESGPIEKTKYNRRGDSAARSDFQRQWRDHLCQTFVWTAIKYSTSPPWPEPEDIEIDWSTGYTGVHRAAALIALAIEEDGRCPGSGQPSIDGKCPICRFEIRVEDGKTVSHARTGPGNGDSPRPSDWLSGWAANKTASEVPQEMWDRMDQMAAALDRVIQGKRSGPKWERPPYGDARSGWRCMLATEGTIAWCWVEPTLWGAYTVEIRKENGYGSMESEEVEDPAKAVAVAERLMVKVAGWKFWDDRRRSEMGLDPYRAMRTRAYGETVAPPVVDTMREELCPVCGESDTYDGDRCQVCGFVKPPDEFMDPDLDEAKRNDLRQTEDDQAPVVDKNLTCDNCGSNFKGAPADGQQAEPKATAPVVPEKTPVEVVDKDSPKKPDAKDELRDRNTLPKPTKEVPTGQPQDDAGVDAEEPETAHRAGDTCPDCGKGKLQEAPSKPEDKPNDEAKVDDEEGSEEDEESDDENPFAKKKKKDPKADDKSENPKKKPSFPPKKTQKEQSMRPTLAALAAQQEIIEDQDRRIAALEEGLTFIASLAGVERHPKLAGLIRTADENNPAQPLADPASEPPTETTEQALAPEAKDDVTSVGATPLTDVAPGATSDVTEPVEGGGPTNAESKPKDTTPPAPDLAPIGGSHKTAEAPILEEPLDLNEVDVTAPVQGTEGPRPLDEVKIETEVRAGTPATNEPAFPLQGDFAQRARTTGASEGRTIASLRLARLRMQAGIASTDDDLTLGSQIAASEASDEVIQAEIDTLARVVQARPKQQTQANRRLVPRQAATAVPSFQEPEIPIQTVASAVSDEEFAFE